ncbi:UNVERIFIED_CONTAM: hypothetical protein Slati_2914300 [Sesamum latifolium]|uniref:Endonuclease/exonuclease/phosphatase n=1 Tax=Sesamum latifolium TaxID=2727402 RepID=A0AAW2VGJ4_9LAMI
MLRCGFSPSRTTILMPHCLFLENQKDGDSQVFTGDFNEVLVEHEKQGQLPPQWWKIEDSWRCLMECDLHDMGFVGSTFMWCNRREFLATIRALLDCACCNPDWISLFPAARVAHEHVACSDYCTVIVELELATGEHPSRPKNQFRLNRSRCSIWVVLTCNVQRLDDFEKGIETWPVSTLA